MIGNLQVLRAIAALGVVLYHINYCIVEGVHTDFMGVATFFVISGFIMCFITRKSSEGFIENRIIRIVPLYWICTFALLFLMFHLEVFKPSTWLSTPDWRPDEPIWVYVGRSLLFLPSKKLPTLGVGWTLNFEIYFYVVFALALWISQRLAPFIASAVVVSVMAVNWCNPDLFLTAYYSDSYIKYFLAGIALFYLWRWCNGRVPKPLGILCAIVIVSCYALQVNMTNPGNWFLVIPPSIVGAALLMSASSLDIRWRPLILLGDASYAIYLTHTIVIEFIRSQSSAAIEMAKTDAVWCIGLFALCVLVGALTHLAIERPMLRLMRLQRSASVVLYNFDHP